MAQKKKTIPEGLQYEADYEIDLDEISQDRQEAELSGEYAVPWWKPKEGRNEIRVLPPMAGTKRPYKKAFLHYGLGPIPITCPGRKSCPVCKHLGTTPDRNHALSGSKRIFFNIIDIENPDAGVHVWSAGNSFFKFFLDHMEDEEEWGDITHPVEGFNAIIDRKGVMLDTKYTYRLRRNPSPIAEDQEDFDDILEARFDLDSIAPDSTVATIDDLLEAWLTKNPEGGTNSDELEKQDRKAKRKKEESFEEDDDDDDEKPPARRKRKKTKAKPKPEEEEATEEEAEDDEPEEEATEEEAEDDEPEDDEPEEESDEEPEPPPKKKPKAKPKAKPGADDDDEEVDLDDLMTELEEDE